MRQHRTRPPLARWASAALSLSFLLLPSNRPAGAAAPASAQTAKPINALLVLGGCCHDYKNQQKLITEGISARANVQWTIAYDPDTGTRHKNPVYDNPDWYKGFDVVVHDECTADVKDVDFIEKTVLAPHKAGLPAVVLHCGEHSYRSEGWPKDTPWFQFTGVGSTGHGPQLPIAISFVDKDHPATKGLDDWTTINEEHYNNVKVYDTAHPLARGKQTIKDRRTGKETTNDFVVAWTNTYAGKTRVFATTIGHNNATVNDPRYLDLITRGLLWAVDKSDAYHAPQAGAPGAGVQSGPKAEAPKPQGEKPAAAAQAMEDVAHGRPAVASSHQDDSRFAGMAVDGDLGTRWCASNDTFPQSITVDLGKPQDLSGARVTWEKDEVPYRHRIESSLDGKAWATVVDRTQSPAKTQVESIDFNGCCADMEAAKGARFVRLTVTGAQEGAWASLYEFEVFGTQPAKKVTATISGKTGQTGAAAASADQQRRILAGLTAPEGFNLTLFAAPPEVNYPTCLAVSPTGTLFVGIDEMGSLGRQAGRGRVMRLIDSDNDGVADQQTLFAKIDHPRGLVWNDATNTLYVLHPPFLSAYHDDNGDGVSDRSEVLVKGVTNEASLKARGADHTTNGIRQGVDGWIYIAMGDFGALHAEGTDGTVLVKHGGGVVRVRPDGTGLEEYTRGQRNIYDVAIDPLMNAYTRDNTNDGDGWDVRLSYIVPTGNYGYPTLFKNFAGEFVEPLADYGGGSPCGSLFVDEPSLSSQFGNTLYTVEWGRSAIMRHPLSAEGAGFKADQQKFMDLPRGTDMEVDGQGRFYLSSWANGGFDYSGPNVGYVIRLAAKDAHPAAFPDLTKAGDADLLKHLASPSGTRRTAAQHEILKRGDKAGVADGLEKLARAEGLIQGRVAAIFTLKQLRGAKADAALAELAKDNDVREFALRALADRKGDKSVRADAFVSALTDSNPRVRLVAAWGLGRLCHAEAASSVVPLVADADPLVSHVAVNSLVALDAADACLKAIDSSNPKLIRGAARVLQALHEPRVVDGLIARVKSIQDPALRAPVYRALCRLAHREADWDGGWWGTRPDTSGPYYKTAEWEGTAKVKQFLASALNNERPEVMRSLVVDVQRNKVDLPEAMPLIAKLAATDPSFKGVLVDVLTTKRNLTADDVNLLAPIVRSDKEPAALRAKALRLLVRGENVAARDATVEALTGIVAAPDAPGELTSAFIDLTRDQRNGRNVAAYAKLAESGTSPAQRELGYTVLLNVAASRGNRAPGRQQAADAIERAWRNPATAAGLLRAIARTKTAGYDAAVTSHLNDANAEVAQAAGVAAERLGLNKSAAAKGPTIETIGFEKTVELAKAEKGDAKLGAELFVRQGCVNCHTTSASEPPKGPFLGGVAQKYSRVELCESILKPSAKISQGFETQWFRTKDPIPQEGFVTRESGDEIELRNATGQSIVLRKQDVKSRGKRDISVMPEGLVLNLTPQELASLLAYLESLPAK